MKILKYLLIFCLFFYFFGLDIYTRTDEFVVFEFALTQSDEDGNISSVPWEEYNIIHIPAGRMLKFYFKPVKNAFLYIYYKDSLNFLDLIYPVSFSLFKAGYPENNGFLIPPEENWFLIDGDVENDTFYVFVSNKRLKKLEKMTNKYLLIKQNDSDTNTAKCLGSKHALLEEIKRLINSSSPGTLMVDPVEIIPFSGSIKSVEQEISQFAKKIETEVLYAKAIEMEH